MQKSLDRPYFNAGVTELRGLTEGVDVPAQVLKDVIHELDHRSTNAASKLRAEIQARLSESEESSEATGRAALLPGAEIIPPTAIGADSPPPSPRNTSGQRVAAPRIADAGTPDPGQWTVNARPPWWLRLLGRGLVRVQISGPTLSRVHQGIAEEIPLSAIDKVSVERGWFGASVHMRASSGAHTMAPWPRLVPEDAEEIAAAVHSGQFGRMCAEACDDFRLLIDSQGYLNHRPVAQWESEVLPLWKRVTALPRTPAKLVKTLAGAAALERFRATFQARERLVAERNDRYVAAAAEQHADFFAKLEKNPLTPRRASSRLSGVCGRIPSA